jgi:hypothetical protein
MKNAVKYLMHNLHFLKCIYICFSLEMTCISFCAAHHISLRWWRLIILNVNIDMADHRENSIASDRLCSYMSHVTIFNNFIGSSVIRCHEYFILFIYAVRSSVYSIKVGLLVSNEVKRIWKEVVMT